MTAVVRAINAPATFAAPGSGRCLPDLPVSDVQTMEEILRDSTGGLGAGRAGRPCRLRRLTRRLAGMLYGVRPLDPVVLGGVSLLLAAVALLASYLPARRAARIDPIAALRGE